MEVQKVKNRWLIAACAVGVHISIGSVYAYSVWILPLNALHGWHKTDISLAFSLAILLLGFSAAFLGPRVERMGPRKSGRMSALFYALGAFGSAFAVHSGSLPLFLVSYGIIGGIGLGTGYITPVSTLVKWFPDRRGMATGIAIMGFGFGAMVFGPVIAALCESIGPGKAFAVLGAAYFLLIQGSALYLAPPPEGWVPAGFRPDGPGGTRRRQTRDLAYMTVGEALRTRRFYYMWIMMFINISCGIALISVASPMAQQVTGMSAIHAASLVGLMGLFNGIGRIGWSSLSDYIGRPQTYVIFFVLQIGAFLLLTRVTTPLLFEALLLLIMTCYGGGFSTLPAFLGDMFGTRQLGTIHGYELTAWGIAGMVGPGIVSRMQAATGGYDQTLYLFTGFFVLALITSCLMAINVFALRRRQNGELGDSLAA